MNLSLKYNDYTITLQNYNYHRSFNILNRTQNITGSRNFLRASNRYQLNNKAWIDDLNTCQFELWNLNIWCNINKI